MSEVRRRHRPVQFAVVREDPAIELGLLSDVPYGGRVLCVASGGCTLLAMTAARPDIEFLAVDPNPAQLALVEAKLAAWSLPDGERHRCLGLGMRDHQSLSAVGNFEALFRSLQTLLEEHVRAAEEWERVLRCGHDERLRFVSALRKDTYWPAVFRAVFCDDLLHAMFGPEATGHAEPQSYPSWFQGAFERLLTDPGAPLNPFLHHALRGCYRPEPTAWPHWLRGGPPSLRRVELRLGALAEVTEDWGRFDFVNLSNVPDWLRDGECAALGERLSCELAPGARVLHRRLNHPDDPLAGHEPWLTRDASLDEHLTARERSGFYGAVSLRQRTTRPWSDR